MFSNFANLYIILFILVKGGVVTKKVKFIIIEFVEVLNSKFLFYLLINKVFV